MKKEHCCLLIWLSSPAVAFIPTLFKSLMKVVPARPPALLGGEVAGFKPGVYLSCNLIPAPLLHTSLGLIQCELKWQRTKGSAVKAPSHLTPNIWSSSKILMTVMFVSDLSYNAALDSASLSLRVFLNDSNNHISPFIKLWRACGWKSNIAHDLLLAWESLRTLSSSVESSVKHSSARQRFVAAARIRRSLHGQRTWVKRREQPSLCHTYSLHVTLPFLAPPVCGGHSWGRQICVESEICHTFYPKAFVPHSYINMKDPLFM